MKNEKFHHVRSVELLTSFWQTLCKILLRWKMRNFTMWGVWKSLLHFNRRFVKSFCVEKWEISPCWGVWNTLLHSNRRFVKSFCVEKRKISPCEENTNFSRSLFPRKKLKIFFIILSYWGYSELNYNVKNDIKRRKKL